MRFFLYLVSIVSLGFSLEISSEAAGQTTGRFEICVPGQDDCSASGTIGLACLGTPEEIRDIGRWRNSGDAMRSRDGKWEMYYAGTKTNYGCARVLNVKVATRNRNRRRDDQIQVCSGTDISCQQNNQIGLACFLKAEDARRPSIWQYTGDAMRVLNGQWEMYYSTNGKNYKCESVVVGQIDGQAENRAGARAATGGLLSCRGDDKRCQKPNLLAVSCEIEGNGFRTPEDWHYTGRSLRVNNGVWQMLYPSAKTYECKNIVVTRITRESQPNSDSEPDRSHPREAVPRGTVIIFDRGRCPPEWSRIGQVRARQSAVSGMIYCRLD